MSLMYEDISLYWKTVLDTIQEGLLILSTDGQIISVNRAAEEITGYQSAELIGHSCTILECTGCRLYDLQERPEWCELFVRGSVESKRCQVKGKNNQSVDVLKRASTLMDENGEVIGAVEALTDITGVVRNEREILRLRRSMVHEAGFHGIIGNSPAMRRVFSIIEDAARSDAAVMISGESGTGKELVARAIHKLSPRSAKPFVKVDCVTLNENIMESELFGHIKGAFTGADRTRIGRFESAEGGHVFLDEIGDVPPSVQVKLLRVLEEKVIERVGDNRPTTVDVRVITATNRDMPQLLRDGLFREDLYYRINVVPIEIPPLRERREDIPLLLNFMVDRLTVKSGKPIEGFTPEAMAMLYDYAWPGNVRELRNAVEYAFVVCQDNLIKSMHLPNIINQSVANINPNPAFTERDALIEALKLSKGNQSEAARILGVSRMTIWKRLKKYDLNVKKGVD